MRCAADLDVAPDPGGGECVEQPARVSIGAHSVPFASDDRDRRLNAARIIGELAGPSVVNVLKRAARHLYRRRYACPALRIDIEIAFAPFLEVMPKEDRSLAARNGFGEAFPLVFERDQPPSRQVLAVADRLALCNWAEKDEPVDEFGAALGEPAGHDRSPGMGNDRDPPDPVMFADEPDGAFELAAGIIRTAERFHAFGWQLHLRIGIGEAAKPVEIERPHLKPGVAQLIAPRPPVEPMSDCESGRKCAAMHV